MLIKCFSGKEDKNLITDGKHKREEFQERIKNNARDQKCCNRNSLL